MIIYKRMYTIADYRYIYYVDKKERDDWAKNCKKMKDFKKREDATQIRRPNSYIEKVLQKAWKKVMRDENYKMEYNEMSLMKEAIKYMQSAREKTFKRRMDILEEFCRIHKIDPKKILENKNICTNRIAIHNHISCFSNVQVLLFLHLFYFYICHWYITNIIHLTHVNDLSNYDWSLITYIFSIHVYFELSCYIYGNNLPSCR